MTTFLNHQTHQNVTVTTSMRKIVCQLNHHCAETGEKITVKKFLLGDDLKANEETN